MAKLMSALHEEPDEDALKAFTDRCADRPDSWVTRELLSTDFSLDRWEWTPTTDSHRWARYGEIRPADGSVILLTGFGCDLNRPTLPVAIRVVGLNTALVVAHVETWGLMAGVKPPREGITIALGYLVPAITVYVNTPVAIEVALSDMRVTSRVMVLGYVLQQTYELLGEEPDYTPRAGGAASAENTRALLTPPPPAVDTEGRPLPPVKQQEISVSTSGGDVMVKIAGEGADVNEEGQRV